jgi:PPM family protein phosphatase
VDRPSVQAHGRSDVGRVRPGNEDALLIGSTVFAVADGMGGHRAGEVASAAALEPLGLIDGRPFGDPARAIAALTEAVTAANADVVLRSRTDPDLEGMGTTLTAVLIEGSDAHLVHVGDSRAYLARDGRLTQLTADHTLVQALIDEGRLRPDQVATHPHRSVITRAVGVAAQVEVDGLHLQLEDGDVLLLCSDGLTGVVDDTTIARLLAEHGPRDVVDALIEAANAAGGPDNITVVTIAHRVGATQRAAGPGPQTVRIRTDEPSRDASDWASGYSNLGARNPSRPGGSAALGATGRIAVGAPGRSGGRSGRSSAPREGRRVRRLLGSNLDRLAGRAVIALITLVLSAAAIGLGAQLLLDRAYLVGVHEDEVVIFRGFDVQVGPVDLLRVHERPGITLAQVPGYLQPLYLDGRPAADLNDARRIVASIPLVEAAPPADAADAPDTRDAG